MKGMISVNGYNQAYNNNYNVTDINAVLNNISTPTKIGIILFVLGKLTGILAIPCVFMPSLHFLAIPLIVCWGGFIFSTIVICSVDHFYIQSKKSEQNKNKALEIRQWIKDNPEFKSEILSYTENDKIGIKA